MGRDRSRAACKTPEGTAQSAGGALDLTVLRYFRAIAQVGNITAAARQLGVSQPALSVAVRRLEAALGTSLFVRRRDGVIPTPTGKELLAHANDILMSVHRAEQAILSLEIEDVGRFVIGCPDVLGAYFLPEFLKRMLTDAPKIELVLWNGSSRLVERAVLERDVQFGLVARFFPNSDLVYVDLFSDTTALLVLGEPATTVREARERLRRGPLSYVEGLPQEQELLRTLTHQGLLPEQRLACGTSEMVKSIGLTGMGVVILPERVAAYGQEGKLRVLHPSLPSIRDQLGLVYRADWHRTRAATRVKDGLIAHARSFQSEGIPHRDPKLVKESSPLPPRPLASSRAQALAAHGNAHHPGYNRGQAGQGLVASSAPSTAPSSKANLPERPLEVANPPTTPTATASSAPDLVPKLDALREESILLANARAAVRRGDARAALAALETARSRYPNGALAQEREVLTIEALSQSGESAAASTRASAFLRNFPSSPHAAHVRTFVR